MKLLLLIYKKMRIFFYKFISEKRIDLVYIQPVLTKGIGKLSIERNVQFGVEKSPLFYSSYSYLEVRAVNSKILIGENTYFNNNACIISDGCTIKIGKCCLFGINLQILDSDFHCLDPKGRFNGGVVLKSGITIGDNVFVGNNVTILKGVDIGSNSTIANGSVVSRSLPDNVIAGGVPARVIGKI
ncbi:hypothetical protein J9B83_10240 [Marinomonas sp. A79]|uniref:Acetyltransferase n=1 Tax=Marinomonas vulgaris TaxID=2823372 RepID=A0ABS5HCD3_9GAMM|nr:DapH/DapD/GlmU-related protein [Marinomonas vulgaris]MBR7889321.1 hypothetical protein [Marinomonas vulgaris]